MSSGNSSSRRHRGPKPARCTRGANSEKNSYTTSSTQSTVSTRNSNRSSSSEMTVGGEGSDVSSSRSAGSLISFTSECNVMAPDLKLEDGDRKSIYELQDKGKLVVIHRKDGTLVYMLRCVDGRRVYIEKGKEGASLMLSNQRGKIIKAIAGEY